MTKVYFYLSLLVCCAALPAVAQYAPQAPLTGHQGIIDSSHLFQEWADGGTIYRGWLNIADKSLGQPTVGNNNSVLGYPDADVYSLGDSGVAVLTFPHSIKNGAGPDFAVFENGFSDPLHPEMSYMELAFVEVSSDGANFVRFPASCNIQDTLQIDNFSYSNASLVNNLAGKYKVGYGTPFDLEELKNSEGLDINNITHIRIVDVVGALDSVYASFDQSGRLINDAYPTAYISGGFDLNAVGVINSNKPVTAIHDWAVEAGISAYPNPVTGLLNLKSDSDLQMVCALHDITGKRLMQFTWKRQAAIHLDNFPQGLYLLHLNNGKNTTVMKIDKR